MISSPPLSSTLSPRAQVMQREMEVQDGCEGKYTTGLGQVGMQGRGPPGHVYDREGYTTVIAI